MHSTPDYLFDLPADRIKAKWRSRGRRAFGWLLVGLAVAFFYKHWIAFQQY